jgi:hypothetical protein
MSCRNMTDCLDQEELDNSKVSTILDMFSSVRLSLSTLREIEKRGGGRRPYVLTGRKVYDHLRVRTTLWEVITFKSWS